MTPQSRKEVIPPHRNALQPRRVKVNNCTADADKNHLHGRRNSRAGIVAQLRRAVLPPRYPPPQAGEGSEGAAAASAPYIRTAYHRTCVVLHRMQFVSELFRHGARTDTVTDQLRPDEDDDFRARLGAVGIAEQISYELDVA